MDQVNGNHTQGNNETSKTNLQLHVALLSLSILALAFVTFIGNLLVILSVALNRRLQTVTGAFITSLATGDLMIALLVVPMIIVSNTKGPEMSEDGGIKACHFTISLAISLLFNSIANLGAISLDRYIAVMVPLRYKALLTKRRTATIIGFVWLFSTFFGFLPYTGWRTVYPRSKGAKGLYCQVPLNLDSTYILTVCLIALIPTVFMIVAYFRIFQTARYHTSMIANAFNSVLKNHGNLTSIDLIKETKAAKMVSIVMGTFLICWLPLFVIMLLEVSRKYFVNSYVYAGAVMFATFNSAFNPFIYAANNREYRYTFKALLKCKMSRNRINAVPT